VIQESRRHSQEYALQGVCLQLNTGAGRHLGNNPQERTIKNWIYKDWMLPVTRSSLVRGSSSIATMATGSTSVLVTEHIINIFGFLDNSTMVEIFKQEGWTQVADIAMLTMQEADGLLSTNSDGRYNAKPMNLHLCNMTV
jgi:hypothetical protein